MTTSHGGTPGRAENGRSTTANPPLPFQAALLHQLGDAVVALDQDECITYLNRTAADQYGVDPNRALGQSISYLYHNEWLQPEDEERADAALHTQGQWRGESRHLCQDGRALYVEALITLLRDAAGNANGQLLAIRDVTARRQTEASLRASELRYRRLADTLPHLVWTATAAGIIDYYNIHIHDFDPVIWQGAAGYDWQSVVHPADLPPTLAAWQRAVSRQLPYTCEHRLCMADGSYRWHLSRALLVHGPDAETRWYGTATDIHERKQAELHQHFLTDLNNQVRLLDDPVAILWTILNRLGAYLQLDRCSFGEVDLVNERFHIQRGWGGDLSTLPADYPLAAFAPPAVIADARAGRPVIVHDVATDARIAPFAATYQQRHIGAYVTVSRVRDEQWVASLNLSSASPRRWQPHEITLAENVLHQCWPLVEKARAEKALRQSEQRFATMFHASPFAIALTKAPTYAIIEVNDAFLELFGFTRNEVIGKTEVELNMLRDPQNRARLVQIMQTQGAVRDFEYTTRRKNGALVTLSLAARVVMLNGESCVLTTIEDITKRKADEEQLNFHASLLDYAYDAVVATDADLNITAWNRGAEALYGWSSADVLGRNVSVVMQSTMTAEARAAALQQMAEQGRFQTEALTHHRDGTPILVEAYNVAMRDHNGQLTGYMNISRDIRQRKAAEEALRHSEERLRLTTQVTGVGIWVVDHPTQAAYWSPELKAIYGFPDDLPIQLDLVIQHVHPADRAQVMATQEQQQQADQDFAFTLEHRIVRADGATRWVEVRGQVLYAEMAGKRQPLRTLGTVIDITERKAVEMALRQNEQQLQSAIAVAQISPYEWNPLTDELTWDAGLRAIWGLPPTAPVDYTTFAAGLHPADRAYVEAQVAKAVDPQGDGVYEAEFRVIGLGDGIERWVAARGQTFFDAQGRPVHFVGAAQEITQRKQAEAHQQFLLDLDAHTRLLDDADAILTTTAARLGQHLGVVHCAFNEADLANDQGVVLAHWRRDAHLPSFTGPQPLTSTLDGEMIRALAAGQSVTVTDVALDPRTATLADRYAALGVHSVLRAPFRLKGELVAVLVVWDDHPRAWRPDEIRLLEDVIARIWPLVLKVRTEAALRVNEHFLQSIADTLPNLLYLYDLAANRNLYANRQLGEMLGYTAAEVQALGEGFLPTLMHPADWATVGEHIARLMTLTDGATVTREYRMRHKQGEWRWLWGIETIFARNADGSARSVLGVVQEITERKALEEALRASETTARHRLAELEAIYATAPVGLCVMDTALRWVRINERLAEINGFPVEAHIGRALGELLPAMAPTLESIMREVLETQQPILNRELQGETAAQPDVERFWLAHWFPLYDDTGALVGINIVTEEITERKRQERQLLELNATLEARVAERTHQLDAKNAELERSNKELEKFAYIASHDLRSPLRAIDNLAKWIVEDAGHLLPAPSKEHLDKLRGRIQRMERLLDDLLAYSRITRFAFTRERVDVARLLQDVVALLNIPPTFQVTIAATLPLCHTQRVPLETVLRNLISNAIKHHHRADGHVHVEAQDEGTWLKVVVSDDGPGIPPQFHDKIFEIFQTLKPRDSVDGSGMGLALVKKAIDMAGGTITVHSSEGAGATFTFTWPKG